jgi:hypothetical protein
VRGDRHAQAAAVGIDADGSFAELLEHLPSGLERRAVREGHLEPLSADLALQLVRRAVGDGATMVDDHDVIGQAVGLLEVLRRHEQRRPAAGQLGDEIPHRQPALRIQARGRLVEEDDRRLHHERGAEVQAATHAARVGSQRSVGRIGQLEALENVAGALLRDAGAEPIQASDHVEVLAAGEQLVERRVLAGHAHLLAHRVGMAQDVDAGHRGGSGVGPGQGGEHADRGRLAGAVRAEDAQHLALLGHQVEAAKRVGGAE